jgi:hypothetical protein
MTQAIIFTNETGGVSVCIPTGELPIEAVQIKDTPAGSIIVDIDSLPNNDFFNAWELADGVVTVNFNKAVEITKQRLRIERTPLLQAQDVLFQRALESGADTSAIVAEKQRLRDITQFTDTTLDELKALKAEIVAEVPVEIPAETPVEVPAEVVAEIPVTEIPAEAEVTPTEGV